MRSWVRIDGVAWNRKLLLAEPPPLATKEEFVGILAFGVDLDLRRHVRLGVLLLEHRDWRELRIAQMLFQVSIARALGGAASSPSVQINRPFLPMMMAVPVSWHIGSTPPAEMLAFFRRS